MDKILVTLILVLIGVGALIGLSTWEESQINTMEDDANTTIQNIINE